MKMRKAEIGRQEQSGLQQLENRTGPITSHLFERFYRADQARTRETPGVGLGLSLIQEVVRAYGGRVTIDSAGIDQGTTVDVWWPLPTAAEMAQ